MWTLFYYGNNKNVDDVINNDHWRKCKYKRDLHQHKSTLIYHTDTN